MEHHLIFHKKKPLEGPSRGVASHIHHPVRPELLEVLLQERL